MRPLSNRYLLALVLFLGSLVLDTRENQFPYLYHPDEPGKVDQVLKRDWNFHHPLLLLLASRGAITLARTPPDPQATVEVGRWVAAIFASIAVAVFGLLAFHYSGAAAGWIAGLIALLHHQFFELAHYMKEDTALLMGVALAFLALAYFRQRPGYPAVILCGIAAAIAISGKYIGVVMVPVALPVLLSAGTKRAGRSRLLLLLAYTGALVLGLAALNFPVFENINLFQGGLSREMDGVVNGHHGLTRRVPNFVYTKVFLDNSNPALWILIVWQLIHFIRTRRDRGMDEWMLHAFPFAFTILLSCSPKTNDRYFLPVTGVLCCLAGMGAVNLADAIGARRGLRGRLCSPAAFLVVAAAFQLWSLARYWCGFASDDRMELIAYIREHLPASAVILEDKRVQIPEQPSVNVPDPTRRLSQRVIEKSYAADIGSLADARAKGVTDVAVADGDYGRFFLTSLVPQDQAAERYNRRKSFYEDLFKEGRRIWAKDSDTVLYLHPGLELYELRPAPAK